jgi:5-methylcytosine-specific restriction endonuclease McrA
MKKRAYQKAWKARRRQQWIDENGPCVDCGSWERPEVDHKVRKGKAYHPSDLWGMSLTNPRRIAELAKCVVRCHWCHLAKTAQENTKHN